MRPLDFNHICWFWLIFEKMRFIYNNFPLTFTIHFISKSLMRNLLTIPVDFLYSESPNLVEQHKNSFDLRKTGTCIIEVSKRNSLVLDFQWEHHTLSNRTIKLENVPTIFPNNIPTKIHLWTCMMIALCST